MSKYHTNFIANNHVKLYKSIKKLKTNMNGHRYQNCITKAVL